MKGRRVAVFDPKIRTTNPMTALLFTNTSGHQLEEGPVYVDEGNESNNTDSSDSPFFFFFVFL